MPIRPSNADRPAPSLAALVRLAALALVLSIPAGTLADWSPPKPVEEGWRGSVELGGQSLGGNARSQSITGVAELGWARERLEGELAVELLESTVSLVTVRRDTSGEPVLDASGRTILELRRGRTHERRAAGVRLRGYWTPRAYQFAQFERERDAPVGTRRLQRLVTGAGYKLWRSEEDFVAAELGAGEKRLDYVDDSDRRGSIGYVAVRAVRRVGERLRLEAALDADFAGDDPFAAAKLGIGLRVTERVTLKLRHTERHNTREPAPDNPLDSRRDTLTTMSLQVELF